MKRPLPKLPKGLQLVLIFAALLLLALSYWQFKGCPRLSAAGELRRMERAHQYEQTELAALLPQRNGGHLAIGLSDDRLHVTLLQKKGLWWLGEVSYLSGLISLQAGEEAVLTVLPWAMPDNGEEPTYYWAALVYAPGTQAADGALTLTVEDTDSTQQWSFPGRLHWQQDGLYLFLLEVGEHLVSQHALGYELHHYLLGDPDPPRYGIWMEGALYDQSGAALTTLYKAYPIRK